MCDMKKCVVSGKQSKKEKKLVNMRIVLFLSKGKMKFLLLCFSYLVENRKWNGTKGD